MEAGRISSPDLVGRDPELGRIDEALARAAGGSPVTMVISGEAGVGKTRLLAAAAERARDAGATVVLGRCIEVTGGALPFAPIVEVLRELMAKSGRAVDDIVGPSRGELARLLPDLVVAHDAAPIDGDLGDTARTRLFDAILRVVERTSEDAPVVLATEDLHWADDSTRDVLSYLIHNLEGKVLVLVTYRSDDLHRRHPLKPWLANVTRHDRVERLDLQPLDRREVAAQLAAILHATPEDGLVDRVFERSEGNPLFVEELVGASEDGSGLSATLQELLSARIDFLPEDTQEILRVAAAAGRHVNHRLLAAVVDLAEDDVARALRPAVTQNVLVADADGTYTFRHPLLREAAYDDLLPGERAAIHGALARRLTDDPSLGGDLVIAEIAQHWYEAHDLPKTLATSIEAGRASEQLFAYPEAVRHLERALGLWDQIDDAEGLAGSDRTAILQAAARNADRANDPARAVALLRRALEDPLLTDDRERAALLRHFLARYLQWGLGDDEGGQREFEAAVALLEGEPASEAKARILAEAALNLMVLEGERGAQLAEEAMAVAREAGARAVEGFALNVRGQWRMTTGKLTEAIEDITTAAEIARSSNAPDDLGRAYIGHSEALYLAGRVRDAIALAQEGAAEMDPLGSTPNRDFLLCNAIYYATFLGDWDEVLRTTGDMLRGSGYWSNRLIALSARAEISAHRGDLEEAQRCIAEGRPLLDRARQPQYVGPWYELEALVAIGGNDLEGAARHAAQALEATNEEAVPTLRVCALAGEIAARRAENARAHGDVTALAAEERLADELIERAKTVPYSIYPSATAHFAQLEAERARIAGEHDPARWAGVAEKWEALGYPVQSAYARLREAEAHLYASSDRKAATEPLRSAHAHATGLRAAPLLAEIVRLAQRARVELDADPDTTPGDVTAPAARGDVGLTAREKEVLELVAAGKTNREIAETLFISDKTASVHVSHILTKLGARSRVEAAAFAHKLGLVGGSE